ncbi:hypothetical protein [uncultured Sphingomonas sp.]|uniref:hypothetical protein n=1 Tax=uncultured Sphingomonas sp. TaxID=158754 RepID=UPI0025D99707|nr:hypothetical protein [uncultured Sphingomonas sp.]
MTDLKVSDTMHRVLAFVAAADANGRDMTGRGSTLLALKRRGLIEYRGSRALPRVNRWHASAEGRAWLAAQEAVRHAG